jgi:predicted kinase
VLVVMAGLPAAGKSTVAEGLAKALRCAVLSVDPVEAAIWRAGVSREQPTGLAAYVVVEALAAEQLALGNDVIVDAVNAVEPAREQWRQLAARTGARLVFIEVRCSDADVHRRRLLSRQRSLDGFPEPTWDSVQERRPHFDDWRDDRLVLDSMASLDENLRLAREHLGASSAAADARHQRPVRSLQGCAAAADSSQRRPPFRKFSMIWLKDLL